MKQLFKWTGSKKRMKKVYGEQFFPENFTKFVDVFAGALNTSHWCETSCDTPRYILNDFNNELVGMYKALRDEPEKVIGEALRHQTIHLDEPEPLIRKEYYVALKDRYCMRDGSPHGFSVAEEAAALLYMLKVNFNGWWKAYNYAHGRYSTPPGLMAQKKDFMDEENLWNHATFFKDKCDIQNVDFESVSGIDDTCFVYLDPPYRDSSTTYTTDGFNEADQIRLCDFFKECDAKGAKVALSNKEIGDGFFNDHLGDYNLNIFDAKYTAGRGTTINKVKEILVTNYDYTPPPPPPPKPETT